MASLYARWLAAGGTTGDRPAAKQFLEEFFAGVKAPAQPHAAAGAHLSGAAGSGPNQESDAASVPAGGIARAPAADSDAPAG